MIYGDPIEESNLKMPVSLGGFNGSEDLIWYYVDLRGIEDPRYSKLSGFIDYIVNAQN